MEPAVVSSMIHIHAPGRRFRYGKPCKRCGSRRRYTTRNQCVKCAILDAARYRKMQIKPEISRKPKPQRLFPGMAPGITLAMLMGRRAPS